MQFVNVELLWKVKLLKFIPFKKNVYKNVLQTLGIQILGKKYPENIYSFSGKNIRIFQGV